MNPMGWEGYVNLTGFLGINRMVRSARIKLSKCFEKIQYQGFTENFPKRHL
jgi:hypothetical protein